MNPRPFVRPEIDLEHIAFLYRHEMARWHEEGHVDRERAPKPRAFIAEQLGVSRATAHRRIQAARAAGLLGPALRTRGGEKEEA